MTPDERRRWIAENIGTDATDVTAADLHTIANGPICDANRLYLPAGRLTEAEWRARQAGIVIEGRVD